MGPVVTAVRKINKIITDPVPTDTKKMLMETADEFFDKNFGLYSSFLTFTRQSKEGIMGSHVAKFY